MNKEKYIQGKIEEWESRNSNLESIKELNRECDLYKEKPNYSYESKKIIFPYYNHPLGTYNDRENWEPTVKIVGCSIRKSRKSSLIRVGYRSIISRESMHLFDSIFYDKIQFESIDITRGFEFIYNIFTKEVVFTDVKIGEVFFIQNCIFKSDVTFERCTFDCKVNFSSTIFGSSVKFKNCVFRQGLNLPKPNDFYEKYQPLEQEDVNSLFEITSLNFFECSFNSIVSCNGRKMEELLLQDCEAKNGEIDIRQVHILGDFKIENIQQPNREINVPILCFELKVEQNILFKNIIFGEFLQLKAAMFCNMIIEDSTFQSTIEIGGEINTHRELKKFKITNSTFNDILNMRNVSFLEKPEFLNSHFNKGIDLSMNNNEVGSNE